MWLTNRRLGPLYFCLIGMEIAWFTPFFLLFFHPTVGRGVAATFIGLFAAVLCFVLLLELFSLLGLDWPFYELAVVGSILASTLLMVRLWAYPGMPLGDLRWLGNALGALVDFQQGLRPELVLILASAFLWQRAANTTSRDVGFFGVGVSFRLGLLLMILGAAIFSSATGQDSRWALWLYLGLGLTAVALARTLDKATDIPSQGSLLAPRRFGQLLTAIGITVGGVALLSVWYTPDGIKGALVVGLRPLWILLRPALQLLVWALVPIVSWLLQLLVGLFSSLDLSFAGEILDSLSERNFSEELANEGDFTPVSLPVWVWPALRYGAVLLGAVLVMAFVLLFLERRRARAEKRQEVEEETGEAVTLGGAILGRGVRWLRDTAGLVRRFGLSRQLLAAISVQNIYANLCRLARQRGYPRRPAQPPDDYLPVLAQAFPGQDEALARITVAYMRVHYGEQPVAPIELAQLRQDYQQVRHGT